MVWRVRRPSFARLVTTSCFVLGGGCMRYRASKLWAKWIALAKVLQLQQFWVYK